MSIDLLISTRSALLADWRESSIAFVHHGKKETPDYLFFSSILSMSLHVVRSSAWSISMRNAGLNCIPFRTPPMTIPSSLPYEAIVAVNIFGNRVSTIILSSVSPRSRLHRRNSFNSAINFDTGKRKRLTNVDDSEGILWTAVMWYPMDCWLKVTGKSRRPLKGKWDLDGHSGRSLLCCLV